MQQLCGIKYRKFLANGFHLVRQIQKFSSKQIPTLQKKYRNFVEKRYPSRGKSTENFSKITHV